MSWILLDSLSVQIVGRKITQTDHKSWIQLPQSTVPRHRVHPLCGAPKCGFKSRKLAQLSDVCCFRSTIFQVEIYHDITMIPSTS